MAHCYKQGSLSVILNESQYQDYFPFKKGKFLKITKKLESHNEFKTLEYVRKIPNYRKYYAIPEEEEYVLNSDDKLYKSLQNHVRNISIFDGYPLLCYYIDNAGEYDMHDTLTHPLIWNSYSKILDFTKQILKALSWLHKNKICHLDVKPENIMIDHHKHTYKLIDFGFASREPFDDYISNVRGTPGYFPRNFSSEIPTEWLPTIEAHDNEFIEDRSLVYKIDSYCFGRVLYFLLYIYRENHPQMCNIFKTNYNKSRKLDDIVTKLLYSNPYTRISITDCLDKYF
jgi:serine/threonine protein kinase